MTTTDHLLFGVRLRSALPLPELAPWPGPAAGAADIVIEEVPPHLAAHSADPRGWSVADDGALLLHIRDHLRLRIHGGCRIEIAIARRDPFESWRLFLLGSGLGALCHQRGLFPLHAASLRIGARTIAIAGPSGAGKSTLSSALMRRGAELLSDDLTVLRVGADGRIELLPAFPRLKLWRDALEASGGRVEGATRVLEGVEKFDLGAGRPFDGAARRLDGLLFLCEEGSLDLRRLSAVGALPAVWRNVFRRRVSTLLGARQRLFAQAAGLAGGVRAYEFRRPLDFAQLDAGAALIEEHFCGAPRRTARAVE
jgi:hypothetical protein